MKPIRPILTVSIICFSVLASIPVATGMIMEQFLKQRFSEGSDGVQVLEIDRGLFSSRIQWKLRGEWLRPLLGTDEILFLDRADHGFLRVRSRTSLEENPWFRDLMSQQPEGEIPLYILTEYRVSGSVESKISLKGFSWSKDGRAVEIMPGEVRVVMDKTGRVSGDLDWQGGKAPGRFQANHLTMDWDMLKFSEHAWDGRISLSLDHLRGETRNFHPSPLELDHLVWEFSSTPDPEKKFLSFGMNTDVNRLEWGAGLVRNGAVRIRLDRVNVPGWQWVMGAYSGILANVLNDMAGAGPDMQARSQMLGKVTREIGFRFLGQCERLLKKGLEFRVDGLKARVGKGGEPKEIQGDMTLTLKKNMTLAGFVPILLRPEAAFEIFDLSTSMTLPGDLADQNPGLVIPILQGMETGLFVRDKNILSHRAEIRDGTLILNQREVHFE